MHELKTIMKGYVKTLPKERAYELERIIADEGMNPFEINPPIIIETLREKYTDFIKKYHLRGRRKKLYHAIYFDLRKIRGRELTKEERSRIIADRKSIGKTEHRRKVLLEFMLEKYGKLDIPISRIMVDIKHSEIWNLYKGKYKSRIRSKIQNDLKLLKEKYCELNFEQNF